jgi:proteasome alpha subunit
VTFPFYVSPEQIMKDRADYARKGIARGRSVVVVGYDDGIAFATENPSRALHKVGEIYDRIAFAAVGKYNEFEALRVAGVRYADLRGYAYDRTDVNARGLANSYAQTMGAAFTTEAKPLEVEVIVAEVGSSPDRDEIYRLGYDGAVAEERGVVVIGGEAERLQQTVGQSWTPGMALPDALTLAVQALASAGQDAGPARTLRAAQLEVAVLDRTRPRRAFRRLTGELLDDLLGARG